MTVCIATANYMVSDSLVSDNTDTQKIFRTKKAIIGIAGDLFEARKFVRWYNDRRRAKPKGDAEFEALIWRPKTGLMYCDQHLDVVPITKPYFAIGSGGDIAKGAYAVMTRFNSSEAFSEIDMLEIAVEVACDELIDCGGRLQRALLR